MKSSQQTNTPPPWEQNWGQTEAPSEPALQEPQLSGDSQPASNAANPAPWERQWGGSQPQAKTQTADEAAVAQYEAAGGGALTSLERGARRLKQSLAGAGAALGDALIDDEGVFDTSPAGRWLKSQTEGDKREVRAQQAAIDRLPQHPAMVDAIESANRADGYVEAAKRFLGKIVDSPDTSGFLIDATAELAPQVLTMLLGAKGVDRLLPTILTGAGRTSAALAGGGFVSSVANTYGPNLAEGLQRGLRYDQAEARAALQSLAQGGVDALASAAIPWKIGPSQITNIPAQSLIQMAGGAVGEIARKRVVGEQPAKGDVVAEALLEVLGLPGDVVASMSVGKPSGGSQRPAAEAVDASPAKAAKAEVAPPPWERRWDDAPPRAGAMKAPANGTAPEAETAAQEAPATQPVDGVKSEPQAGGSPAAADTVQISSQDNPGKPRSLKQIQPDLVEEIEARGGKAPEASVVPNRAKGQPGDAPKAAGEAGVVDPRIATLRAAINQRPASPAAIDTAAHEAATSPQNSKPEPTQAQKSAGNYPKGRIRLHGMDISIENPKGSIRSGKDGRGKAWSQKMQNHYGYFRNTVGRDKDHVDLFLGKRPEDPKQPVFIIDQVNPDTGRFDEHKVILGSRNRDEAIATYQANYAPGWRGIGGIREMPLDKFKAWVSDPKRTQRRATRKRYRYPAKDVMPESGANAFAPGASYVGFIDDARAEAATKKTGKPIRREDVLIPFLKALKVPLYQGRVKRKNALGFYLPKKEAVRIKNKRDLETAAHELAHLIDDRTPEIRRSWRKNGHREELRSISYDRVKTYEGFAEFVRLYMTQNEKAQQVAPKYYAWFQGFTQRHEYGRHIEKAREGMAQWFEQDAISRAASKIGSSKPINEALYSTFDTFRQAVSDDLDGIYRMERNLTGKVNPVGAYESARLTRGAHSIVEGALAIGAPVVNPDGSFGFEGKGLEAVLEPVSGQIEDWTRYAVGRSAQELMRQGREHLFTQTEINAMLQLGNPEFRKAFRGYQTWNRRVVDFAQALGIINPETRKLWKRAQYLPFYRVHTGQRQQADSGVSGDWKGIARLTGGTDNLRDVLQNMIQNASHLIVEAVRNDARVQVADLAEKQRGGGRFMVKIAREARPVKISKDEVIRIVNQAGIIPEDVTADFSNLKDLVSIFQFGQAPKGKNVVAVMRGGKAVYYEVADPLLMRAMTALDRPTKNWITRFLGGFRRVGQSSITLSLDFMAANLARDTLMGGIVSRHGFKPFVDSIRGMQSRIRQDKNYQEFIANEGGFSSVYLDDQAFWKKLERFYGKRGINYRAVIDTPAKLLYAVETVADAFEMSTRLGEYRRAKSAGAHPRHAAYSGREVSTDFAMRGDSEVLGFFYDTVIFLKAGINGMDRLYRGFAHDENRRQIATRTALLALASMALYAINRDNELYDKLEDWDKDVHWHFFIPRAGSSDKSAPEERYHHFRYPKLWEIGAVSSMAERTLEGAINAEPKKLGQDLLRIVLDQFKLDYVPQAIRPLYEQYLNKSRFTGAPIETSTMQQLAPFARSKTYTARVLKDMGLKSRRLPRELQISPARTEALLRGYLNTWAMYGLALADAALYDDKPEMRTDDYPVLKRFYAKSPMKRTRFETRFYEMFREATELRRTLRQMDRIGRPDIADEIEGRKELERYRQLTRGNKALQGIKREMRRVYIDPLPDSRQKRAALDRLLQEKNRLLELVVTDIEQQEAKQAREKLK